MGIFLLFLFFGGACTNPDSVPGNVIARDSMAKILWDIIQADQFSTYYLTKDSSKDLKKETMKLYGTIFQLHHVSRDEFQKSLQFYYSRPDISKIMFDSLSARANRQRGEMYKTQPPFKKTDTGKHLLDSMARSNRERGKTNKNFFKKLNVK
jgi:hypothetical protein